jgi:putative flippase GtrA
MTSQRSSGVAAAFGAGAILLWLVHFALGDHALWLKYVWTAALGLGVVVYVMAFVTSRR